MMIFLGLVLIAVAIGYLGKVINMLDFSRLNAALETLGAAVDNVATAIRNPAVDNNSQANIDAIAGKLDTISEGLTSLADEENAEDNADAIVDDGTVSEPVAVDEGGNEPPFTDDGA